MKYEYGIAFHNESLDDPHRTGMTLAEAEEWIEGGEKDGGRPGAFHIIRREIGSWQTYHKFLDLFNVPPREALTERPTCPTCGMYVDVHGGDCGPVDLGFS